MTNKKVIIYTILLLIVFLGGYLLKPSHEVKVSTPQVQLKQLSDEKALEIIKNLPEVKDFLQRMDKASQKTFVEVRSKERGVITVQFAEDHPDHTATFNWYILDSTTGVIKCSFANYEGTRYVGNNDSYPNCN